MQGSRIAAEAGCRDIHVVITEGQILVDAVFVGSQDIAIGVGDGDGDVGNRILAIGEGQLHVIVDLLLQRDGNVRQAAHHEGNAHSGEVGTHTGIGDVVHTLEGAGGCVHGAVDIAVGEAIVHGSLTLREFDILGDGQGQRGLVHLLILGQRTVGFHIACGVAQVIGGGVKDTGNLIDGAVQVFEGDGNLIAGSEGFAGGGDIGDGGGHFCHTYQRVGGSGGIGHLNNDSTALGARIAERQQADVVSTCFVSGGVVPAGHVGLQVGSGDDIGVAYAEIAACGYGEVQVGLCIRVQVGPGIVVVVPLTAAVGILAAVEGDVGNSGTGSLVGDDKDIGTLGVGCGEQTAMAAVNIRSGQNFQSIIVHSHDVGSGGGHVDPVVLHIAAADQRDVGSIALEDLDVEVRLHHDIARVRVDDFPHAVSTDTGGTGNALEAGGGQEDLQVGFVAGADCGTQTTEAVGLLVGGAGLIKGVGLCGGAGNTSQPAGPGNVLAGGVGHTPGVILAVLGDLEGQRLGAVAIGNCLALRSHFLGVEVVVLEVQFKISCLGNGDRQRKDSGNGDGLADHGSTLGGGQVDLLGENVVICIIGIDIGVIQRTVACCPHEEGELGIVAADIGIAGVDHGAGDGHDDLGIVVVRSEVGVVQLLGGGVNIHLAQIDIIAAVAVDVHFHGQFHALAAQVKVVSRGCGIIAINTGGIAAGNDGSIEHVVIAHNRSAGRCGFALSRRCAKEAVGEGDLLVIVELIVHFIDHNIVGLAVDDGVVLGIVNIFGLAVLLEPADVVIQILVQTGSLVQLQNRHDITIGAIVIVTAQIEIDIGRNLIQGFQGQEPACLGITEAVVCLKLVSIGTGSAVGQSLVDGTMLHGFAKGHPVAPTLAVVGRLAVAVGQGIVIGIGEDIAVYQIVHLVGPAGLNRNSPVFHALSQGGQVVQILAADITNSVRVFIGAGFTFYGSCGDRQNGSGRSNAGVLGILCAGIHSHQVVSACSCRCGESQAVSGFGIIGNLHAFHRFPFVGVQAHIQAGYIRKACSGSGSSPLLGFDGQRLAGFGSILVLIESCEITIVVELPVGEHGYIPGISVRQQDVVGGGTPARAHIGIAVVTEIHQVLIMAPEVDHVDAGGTTSGRQGLLAFTDVGRFAIHIKYVRFSGIAQDAGSALAAVLLVHAQVVAFQQVDVQVQAGGTLDYCIIDIFTGTVGSTITVIVFHSIQCKIKVRNGYFQMRHRSAIGTGNRITIVGKRHIYRYRRSIGFIVVILSRNACVACFYCNGQLMADFLFLALGSQGYLIGSCCCGEIENAAVNLGMLVFNIGCKIIGQRMTFAVREYLIQIQTVQFTSFDCGAGRSIFRHAQAGSVFRDLFYLDLCFHSQSDRIGRAVSLAVICQEYQLGLTGLGRRIGIDAFRGFSLAVIDTDSIGQSVFFISICKDSGKVQCIGGTNGYLGNSTVRLQFQRRGVISLRRFRCCFLFHKADCINRITAIMDETIAAVIHNRDCVFFHLGGTIQCSHCENAFSGKGNRCILSSIGRYLDLVCRYFHALVRKGIIAIPLNFQSHIIQCYGKGNLLRKRGHGQHSQHQHNGQKQGKQASSHNKKTSLKEFVYPRRFRRKAGFTSGSLRPSLPGY